MVDHFAKPRARDDTTAALPAGSDDAGPELSAEPETNVSQRPVYRLFGRSFRKPGSRKARIALGVALSVAGLFGFLPVLGFWMVPLGLLILSHEYHLLRRLRRRWEVRAGRRRAARLAKNDHTSSKKG